LTTHVVRIIEGDNQYPSISFTGLMVVVPEVFSTHVLGCLFKLH